MEREANSELEDRWVGDCGNTMGNEDTITLQANWCSALVGSEEKLEFNCSIRLIRQYGENARWASSDMAETFLT